MNPHLLRHSYATHLMENGADLLTVQALLGHTDLKHTAIYLHLSQRHLKAAGTPLDHAVLAPVNQIKGRASRSGDAATLRGGRHHSRRRSKLYR